MDTRRDRAAKRWGLERCEEIYRHPTKAVFLAESERFGPVILKIDENTPQLKSEYRMLAGLSGSHSCKVYAYDESEGLLLEERIFPGTVLRGEPSLEKRVRIFARVFREIHRPAEEGETYLDWLERICEYCKRKPVAEEAAEEVAEEARDDVAKEAYRAREFCAEMFGKYPDRMLLHGDLHHDNLLFRTDGSYAMIDPKGVIGPAILDLPRFLLNELDTDHASPDRQHIQKAMGLLAGHTGYPEADIRKLFYMETVLENVWRMEDGDEMNQQEMEIARSFL